MSNVAVRIVTYPGKSIEEAIFTAPVTSSLSVGKINSFLCVHPRQVSAASHSFSCVMGSLLQVCGCLSFPLRSLASSAWGRFFSSLLSLPLSSHLGEAEQVDKKILSHRELGQVKGKGQGQLTCMRRGPRAAVRQGAG